MGWSARNLINRKGLHNLVGALLSCKTYKSNFLKGYNEININLGDTLPYPYSWTPTRLVPTSASQVKVLDDSGNAATLTVPVAVSAGTITFTLANTGRYNIVLKVGTQKETGVFFVDPTNTDTSTPEWEYFDNADPEASGAAPAPATSLVTQAQLDDPNSVPRASLSSTFANYINLAKNPDTLISGAVTVDGSDQVTSAAVVWPNGQPGTLTITSRDANGAVLAYNITYGSPVTKTYTQPTITRNANGAATNVPAIVVS